MEIFNISMSFSAIPFGCIAPTNLYRPVHFDCITAWHFFPIAGMPFTPTRRFRFRQSDTVCPASYFIIPTMAVIMPSRCFRYRFSSWVSNTFGLISPPAKQFIGKFRPKTNMYGVYPVCIISDWFRARHADLKASFHDNDLSPCVRQNIPFFIIADVLSTTTICADSPAGLVTSTTSEILLYSCHSSDSSPGPPSRSKYRGLLKKKRHFFSKTSIMCRARSPEIPPPIRSD